MKIIVLERPKSHLLVFNKELVYLILMMLNVCRSVLFLAIASAVEAIIQAPKLNEQQQALLNG